MWGMSVDSASSGWTAIPTTLTIDVPHIVSDVDDSLLTPTTIQAKSSTSLSSSTSPSSISTRAAATTPLVRSTSPSSGLASFGIPPSPSDSKRAPLSPLPSSTSSHDVPTLALTPSLPSSSSSSNDITATVGAVAATATATATVDADAPTSVSPTSQSSVSVAISEVSSIVPDSSSSSISSSSTPSVDAASPTSASSSSSSSSSSPAPTAIVDPRPSDWAYGADEAAALKWLLSATSHAPTDGWTFNHTTSTEIIVYTNDTAAAVEGARATCGIGAIEASPSRVLSEVTHPSKWTKWDPLLKSFEFKDLTPMHRVYHLCFNGVFPYGARDIVYLETQTPLPDGSVVIATRGISHPAYPETSSYVRAHLVAGGWHIRPAADNPNRSLVTYFICTDPKLALVPKWVLAMAATRLPAVIDKVRAGVKLPA